MAWYRNPLMPPCIPMFQVKKPSLVTPIPLSQPMDAENERLQVLSEGVPLLSRGKAYEISSRLFVRRPDVVTGPQVDVGKQRNLFVHQEKC